MPSHHHHIVLPGAWDLARGPELRGRLAEAGAAHGDELLVIDLRGSEFGDCSPLHALEDFAGALDRAGTRYLTIVDRQSLAHRMLRFSALEERLGVVDTRVP